MSEKRQGCKGRVLRTGENQRQDSRYMYKYSDFAGKAQYLYSRKLEAKDKTPDGKPDEPSLREKIQMLQRDLEAGIAVRGSDTTVYQLTLKYIQQ